MKKRLVCIGLALALLAGLSLTAAAEDLELPAPSCILMEKQTGQVLYESNAHEKLRPASVTKVMTLLLVMEAIDSGALSYDDTVTGSAHAASMGGSQIWLKEGEQMSVDEMLKCIAVNSANDCAVAMAEHISGSEEAFTKRMNDRAKELIARYPVTLKCDLATDNPNIALRSVNGVAEVTPCDVPEADTVLTVNGELKIASGSAEVLARYLQITVNGQVYCPRSLSGKLGNVAVNGQIITWPDGAVQLKNTAVLDSTGRL